VSPSATLREALASAEPGWLFGRRTDLVVFGGSTLLSLALLALGACTGLLRGDAPPWMWLVLVVGFDVAHVWSTLFRVYLDGEEVRRRALLYVGVPIAMYVCGVLLHGFSAGVFWRVVAYAATWHFMRQQVGWLRLYHRRALAPPSRALRLVEEALLYGVMLAPLVWWHAHLPRAFAWMVQGDYVAGVPPIVADFSYVVVAALALVWLVLAAKGRSFGAPRILLLACTAVVWNAGIVLFDSDYAFTAMNVVLHAAPYVVLTFRYGSERVKEAPSSVLALVLRGGVPAFAGLLLVLAYVEELGWDRLVWHEYPQFFGASLPIDEASLALFAPLLAVPQLTHYVLDGFVWRREGNE
jgi:hypothetical protein